LNIFALLAALALLAHASGRKAVSHYAPITEDTTRPSARAELTHIFLHVLCVLYVRAALWFELRRSSRGDNTTHELSLSTTNRCTQTQIIIKILVLNSST
jgi:hypothetical protein